MLGHKISKNGIEVDVVKIKTIERLPPPSSIMAVRSFLGYARFNTRFIKIYSKNYNSPYYIA